MAGEPADTASNEKMAPGLMLLHPNYQLRKVVLMLHFQLCSTLIYIQHYKERTV